MKKKLTAILLVLMTGLTFAADQKQTSARPSAGNATVLPLAAARARIGVAIKNPKVMKEIMKHLSAADQKQYVAEVNKAISSMPGSSEQKAAAFLSVNMAAITSAAKGNTSTIIAETFATVPTAMLPPIVEQMAEGPLSRKPIEGATYTDAQFEKIMTDLMQKVVDRCAEADAPSPRAALATVMMVKAFESASGDRPDDAAVELTNKLIEKIPNEEARELAREEWIPAALPKDGGQGNVESILASADVTRRPDYNFALTITGSQYHDSVLQDLFGRSVDGDAAINTRTPIIDAVENRLERAIVIGGENGGDVATGMADPEENKKADVPEGSEDRPYQWQTK